MVRRYTGRRRLQSRAVVPHNNRRVGALATVANVGRLAYNNRGIIKSAYKAVKRKFTQKKTSTKRRKGNHSVPGNFDVGGGNDISRSKRTVGRYPALKPNRLLSLIKVGMSDRVERFQGITNFDTNTGFFTIANRLDTTTNQVTQPMHVYNLTVFKNTVDAPTPVLGNAYGWDNETGAAGVTRFRLNGQDATGTTFIPGWTSEKLVGPVDDAVLGDLDMEFPNATKILHEWTEIKLNLYGARRRPTWFNIDFVRVKNEFANFSSASTDNERFKELCNCLTGNMVYSNLQTRDNSALKFLTFVKRMKYFIPAEQSTDLNTACGKIKEVKIFMKHGRILDMRAHETKIGEQQLGHKQEDGIDYELKQEALNTCADGQQLFMIIRAWSPARHTATTPQWLSVGTNYTPLPSTVWTAKADPTVAVHDVPSYDIILRQKYSCPS